MSPFFAEFTGMAMLVLLGDGVVANVVLNKTKGNNAGWIVITFGWAMAVFIGVYAATHLGSAGHLNPAVTLAMAAFGDFDKNLIGPYIGGQFAGAFTGAVIVWLNYKNHFDETKDADAQLAVFSSGPAIRNIPFNFITEAIAAFVLVFGVLVMPKADVNLGTLNALPVALLVLGIGLSLGGPTGYAINPARDLGPRIAHFVLPIPGKRDSDWGYALVPVLGPIAGGLLAAYVHSLL